MKNKKHNTLDLFNHNKYITKVKPPLNYNILQEDINRYQEWQDETLKIYKDYNPKF